MKRSIHILWLESWKETSSDGWTGIHMGEALWWLSLSQQIQLSKYMNDILPTVKWLQTFDNKYDGQCFECQQLWEDMNHVIHCPSKAREQTRNEAFTVFSTHFQKQQTPSVLTNILCDSMEHWIHCHQIMPPQWNTAEEHIMTAITTAFNSQKQIGWDQFFHGWLSTEWLNVIKIYYHKWRPGYIFSPDQWMWTTIDTLWTFSLTLWCQWCESYHGVNGINTLEQKCKLQLSM